MTRHERRPARQLAPTAERPAAPRPLRGEITVTVDGRPVGAWLLPQRHAVLLGRGQGAAIALTPAWVPRTLARLRAGDDGWLLENGPRTRVRVDSRWVHGAYFQPGALVVLQRGRSSLAWDLDRPLSASVDVSAAGPARREDPPYALPRGAPRDDSPAALTALAIDHLNLSPLRRHQMAVLFAHLIEDRPAPPNLSAAAGARLGLTEEQVKRVAYRVRERLNRHRGEKLVRLEDLGYYLVVVSGLLGPDDLAP